jgi:hypothetical protein
MGGAKRLQFVQRRGHRGFIAPRIVEIKTLML